MRRFASLGLVLGVIITVAAFAYRGHAQNKQAPVPKGSPTEQVLMRDKLSYAKDTLDGLAVEDFAKVARSAEMMRLISKASSWYVLDSEEYDRFSKNFQEQAQDLERHAKAKNLDAAALDYMRISLTCVQCHKYLREARKLRK